MHATIEGLWVKQLPTMKGTNYLPFFFFFGSCGLFVFWPSLFVFPLMVSAIDLLLDFYFYITMVIDFFYYFLLANYS